MDPPRGSDPAWVNDEYRIIGIFKDLELYDLCFGPTLKKIKKVDAHTVKEIQKMLSELGFYSGSSSGKLDESTRQALTDFHNMENLEMRFTNEPRTIDEEVLKSMRRRCQR